MGEDTKLTVVSWVADIADLDLCDLLTFVEDGKKKNRHVRIVEDDEGCAVVIWEGDKDATDEAICAVWREEQAR